ncbi:MAG: hypothetical protein BGO78_05680 [Chloroflexi bacterium 44-23]|nr:MAG: hypothetical protein BGO78_05680 [Chloroflexi bacterium 44-23]
MTLDSLISIPTALFDTLYAAFDEAILILDNDRKICYFNATLREWLTSADSFLGAAFPEINFVGNQNCFAKLNLSTLAIEVLPNSALEQALLTLHDESGTKIVKYTEKGIIWGDTPYSLITLTDARSQLESEALQKAIFQISQATSQATDLPALFKIVHEIIDRLIPTPNLFIAIYDEETEFISFPYYVDERDYLDILEKQKLRARDRKVRRGLTEYLLHLGQPLLINKKAMEELSESGEVSVVGSTPIEWLGIPLKTVKGEIIGGIVVQTYSENVRYTQRDVDILNFVSVQIAMAIQRKQTEEKLNQERELFTLGPVVVMKLIVENHEQSTMTYVSPNIDQFGYSPREFLSGERLYKSIIHPQDQKSVFKYGELNFVDGNAFIGEEYRILTKDGQVRWVYDFTYIHQINNEMLVEYYFYILDITDRKETEAELKLANENLENRVNDRTAQLTQSQQFLQLVMDTIPVPLFFKNKNGQYEGGNKAYEALIDIKNDELIGKYTHEIWPADQAEILDISDQELLEKKSSQTYETQIRTIKGDLHDVVFYKASYTSKDDKPAGLVGVILDISARKQFEKLQNTLYLISEAASSTRDLNALYKFVHGVVNQLIPARNLYIALYDKETDIVEFPYFYDEFSPHPEPRKAGNGMTEHVIRKGEAVMLMREDWERILKQEGVLPTGELSHQWLGVPLQTDSDNTIGMLAVQTYNENEIKYSHNHLELLEFVSTQIAQAIEKKRAQAALERLNQELEAKVADRTRQLNDQLIELRQREHELTSVLDLAQALRQIHKREALYQIIQKYFLNAVAADGVSMAILDNENQELIYSPSFGCFKNHSNLHLDVGTGAAGWVVNNKKVYINNNINIEPGPVLIHLAGGASAVMIAPMIVDDQAIGVIEAGANRPWNDDDVRIISAMAEISAYAIQRELLSEQKEGQLQRLNTLREIDRMITSNFDAKSIMAYLLGQIVNQSNADAADILLSNEGSAVIDYGHGLGFAQPQLRESLVAGYPGPAELVMISNEPVLIKNIAQSARWKQFFLQLKAEHFESYYAVPLQAKGQILGVLEIYKRSTINENSDWLEFMQALAQQTAIALENAQLIDKLKKANREMLFAYDRTIEGWAKALEIRDQTTGKHSQKVMQWTMIMAQAMGIRNSEELTHIKRGALLHDIGKMGVSDTILQKPGKLNEEEWIEMRKHPQHAYDLLYPIEFLRPALDIPLYHHEHWDGSGYPKGLKGKEIPLIARIFTVIDVFNAITSKRPYSNPWPVAQAIEYIQKNAGSQFDPDVVQVFMRLKNQFLMDGELTEN